VASSSSPIIPLLQIAAQHFLAYGTREATKRNAHIRMPKGPECYVGLRTSYLRPGEDGRSSRPDEELKVALRELALH
jgi:hypothetical protein